jgi:hypothetical protein
MATKSTESLDLGVVYRTPTPGGTVHVRHLPDGRVTATSAGMTGAGRNEEEALLELWHKLRTAPPKA